MDITLTSLEDTKRLGRALARALSSAARPQLVLLEGGLGAGKTTLARFMVEALPGGGEAEVSSPSFTLCNIYPTRPQVLHYDLYRLEDAKTPADVPDEIMEALDDLGVKAGDGFGNDLGDEAMNAAGAAKDAPPATPALMLVEWPERLPPQLLPPSYIYCRLTAGQNDRRASFTGHGKTARKALEHLSALLLQAGQNR